MRAKFFFKSAFTRREYRCGTFAASPLANDFGHRRQRHGAEQDHAGHASGPGSGRQAKGRLSAQAHRRQSRNQRLSVARYGDAGIRKSFQREDRSGLHVSAAAERRRRRHDDARRRTHRARKDSQARRSAGGLRSSQSRRPDAPACSTRSGRTSSRNRSPTSFPANRSKSRSAMSRR